MDVTLLLSVLQTSPDSWVSRDGWLDAILGPYVGPLGEGLVAAILAGSLLLGFYIHSNNIAFPAILLLIFGGSLAAVLPGPMVNLARTLIVIGMAAVLFAAARRYVL